MLPFADYSITAVNCQLAVPVRMSMVNRSFAATVSGLEVSAVNVDTVPEEVPAAMVGLVVKTLVPFCLIRKERAVTVSENFTVTTHLVKPATRVAGSIGPTIVPAVPILMMNPMESGAAAPAAPVDPVKPVGPVGPATVLLAPVAPVGPGTVLADPVGPVGPGTVLAAPVTPAVPVGPVGPVPPIRPASFAST